MKVCKLYSECGLEARSTHALYCGTCHAPGCPRDQDSKGACSGHGYRFDVLGWDTPWDDPRITKPFSSPSSPPTTPSGKCSKSGCPKVAKCKGFCTRHYATSEPQRVARRERNRALRRTVEGRKARQASAGRLYQKKKAAIDALKVSKGCTDCGFRPPIEQSYLLEWDHLPGFKKVANISEMLSRGWKALWEEIAKCEVVCVHCHRKRTHARAVFYDRQTWNRVYVDAYKLAHGCTDCGRKDLPAFCYDFDHLPEFVKYKAISALMSNRKRLMAEIPKCEVACAHCHKIRTEARRIAELAA